MILLAALGALLYVGASIALDSARIEATLGDLGWLGCAAVLLLSLVNYGLRFHRWRIILRRLGHSLAAGPHLLYYLSGFAFTVSPAKAGEAVRSLYLHDHGVSYPDSVAALFAERALDVVAIVVLASLIVADREAYLPLVIGVMLLTVLALGLIGRKSLPELLRRFATQRLFRLAARVLSAAADLLVSSQRLLKPRLLIACGLIGIVSWAAEGLGLYLICRGLHLPVAPISAIGIYGLAVLAGNAAFFLPAGIGGTEVAMTALLTAQGATVRAAVTATLLCRVATLWFAVLIGIASATTVELRHRVAPLNLAP